MKSAFMLRKADKKGNQFLSSKAITRAASGSTKAAAISRLKRAGILTKSGSLAGKYR